MRLIAIATCLLACCGSGMASEGQVVFTDDTTATVKLWSDPIVPAANCLHHIYIGVWEGSAPLNGVTITITTPHGGIYSYKTGRPEPNKAGVLYADAMVTKLSGYCKITLGINLVKKSNGAEGVIDFEQPVSPRNPFLDHQQVTGGITGGYTTVYDVNSMSWLSTYDSTLQEVYESGTTNVPLSVCQEAHCGSYGCLYPSEDTNSAFSTAATQNLTMAKSARIAYDGEGIIPSKVRVALSLRAYGDMHGEVSPDFGEENEGQFGRIINRITFTSPLLMGPDAIDLKRDVFGREYAVFDETVDSGTQTVRKVKSGTMAINNDFVASIALLMNCATEKGTVNAGSSLGAFGASTMSVGHYEVEPLP